MLHSCSLSLLSVWVCGCMCFHLPNLKNECWSFLFLQISDMLFKCCLKSPHVANSWWWQCRARGLLRFRQKSHLFKVRKRWCFGLPGFVGTNMPGNCPRLRQKYPVLLALPRLGNVSASCQKYPVLLPQIQVKIYPAFHRKISSFVGTNAAG